MSLIPADLRYTRDHQWARLEPDGRITVGITDFAQAQLGEVTGLELPPVGGNLESGEPMGAIDSLDSVSDIYAPVSGVCAEVNSECKDNPETINQDPYDEGWLIVVEPSDLPEFDGLMTADEYEAFVEEEVEAG